MATATCSSLCSVVWLQNRIKELEEALDQERAAHLRVSSLIDKI